MQSGAQTKSDHSEDCENQQTPRTAGPFRGGPVSPNGSTGSRWHQPRCSRRKLSLLRRPGERSSIGYRLMLLRHRNARATFALKNDFLKALREAITKMVHSGELVK